MDDELKVLRESKKYVLLLILGILISLYNLNARERLLLCGEDEWIEKGITEGQWISSAVIFAALIYFFGLTKETAAASDLKNEGDNYAYRASALNLVAGLARFASLASDENENDK